MLKRLVLARLDASERDLGYDMSYLRDVLSADFGAFLRFAKVRGISSYRRDVPAEVAYAVKLVGTMVEDCGPCTQLMVTMAERENVAPDTLRAVLARDDEALSDDLRLAVRFARAVLARDPAADALRDAVRARWGARGLVTLAFGLCAARLFPTLKYALGHGRTCSRVVVGGAPLPVRRASASEEARA
ncbi:MAG: hypothetical protein ABW252_15110 [Polyangiales bacterium]